jgi:long-subunit acyl-CoA synthetase (AMP-forming)
MTAESLGVAVERSRGIGGATLCEAFQSTVARLPDAVAVRTWDGEIELTWREYSQHASRIAAGLAGLGVTRGETVALMMSNRPEFYLCDTAALHLGATPFSIYNTSAPEQITQLLSNASNRVLICERRFLERVLAARDGTSLEHVICVDGPAEGALALEDLEAQTVEIDLEARWRAVEPEDVLTLIYTSGTTGPSKGVVITHASMLAMIRAWTSIMPATPEDRLLSYLPAAHIVDRMTGHYLGMTHSAVSRTPARCPPRCGTFARRSGSRFPACGRSSRRRSRRRSRASPMRSGASLHMTRSRSESARSEPSRRRSPATATGLTLGSWTITRAPMS